MPTPIEVTPYNSNNPSWQQVFPPPSVVPGDYSYSPSSSSYGDVIKYSDQTLGPDAPSPYTTPPASSVASQPASSNWMDYLKAGGLALSAAGDAIRAFRGEPTPPGSSPFQQYLAQEEQKESDKRLAQLLKDAMGASSTEPITGVLDPAAEKRKQGSFFGALPSLAGIGSSTGTRMAGSFLS
jgi:hypothetical protein